MSSATVTPRPAPLPFEIKRITEEDFIVPEWFWKPYIPAGNVTILFGRGGIGKSFITTDIASRASTGQPFPGSEQPPVQPTRVLMVSAEDDMYVVIGPRLAAAGANLANIRIVNKAFTLGGRAWDYLKQQIKDERIGLLIIDPAVSFLGGKVDMNKMNEVREVLGALQDLAKEHSITVLIVHHERKGKDGEGSGSSWERAAGSADFINAARSAIYVHDGNEGFPIFDHVKSNYGPLGEALPYSIVNGRLEWGHAIPGGRGVRTPGRPARARDDAVSFLKAILAPGPMPSLDLQRYAADEGINPRTLARAKEGVARSVRHIRADGTAVWYTALEGWEGTIEERKPDETELLTVDAAGKLVSKGPSGAERGPAPLDEQPAEGAGGDGAEVADGGRGGASAPSGPARPDPASQASAILKAWGVSL